MAIYKEIFRKKGTNAAAIDSGAATVNRFPGNFRVRMTDAEAAQWGSCNTFRLVNKSGVKVRIHWTWGIDNDEYDDMAANSTLNLTAEDGRSSYGFDVECLDTATDVAIGEFTYSMAKVEQVPER